MTDDAVRPGPELTLRSILVGLVVAAIIGSAYPYCVLKLGFGPNLSVVSAFFGFIALVLILRATGTNARENNIVQTMGTSAGQTAFMCVLLAAFDLLNSKQVLNPPIHLGTFQIFFWLCSASLLGILLAVPMRRHYIDEENLTYADGMAAGETIKVLHEGKDKGASAKPVKALAFGGLASGLLMVLTSFLKLFPDTWLLPGMQPMNIGFNWSLLSFGSGLLVGFRICLAMAIGTFVSWFLLPHYLVAHGMIPEQTYPMTLRWVMWPATGLMVAGGLTSLALKWNLIVKTFRGLSASKLEGRDIPMQWVLIGSIVMTVIICLVQFISMGIPVWLSFIAILLTLPLMLVGLRVLGETNWGPISAMSNMMQAVFAFISPGNVPVNMSSSGLTGTIAVTSEALMQDFKAGQLVKSNPRNLTIAQLIAAPVGSMATAIVYPVLRDKFGIGPQGLSSPISVKWAGFAELLTKGLSALPPGCLVGLAIGIAVGIILTLLAEYVSEKTPSPAAIGIGMLIPASVLMTFIAGGVGQLIWARTSPKSEEDIRIPLASGLICGEAILAVVLAVLAALGVNF
ncbi:MAG TPA: OPT family oligopeptide transporter [Pyrinomonadaceae bacterium]|jgi:putative OPT family oligopeptide transporter|nr:OPT family oligopeptide transporter [Pyrinomonadaceae bacterium]